MFIEMFLGWRQTRVSSIRFINRANLESAQNMMTSSNGNIFRVTGLLCCESNKWLHNQCKYQSWKHCVICRSHLQYILCENTRNGSYTILIRGNCITALGLPSNLSCTLVNNKIVDHSDVVGSLPVGAAPTTSSFSTYRLATFDWALPTARRDEKFVSFGICCVLY